MTRIPEGESAKKEKPLLVTFREAVNTDVPGIEVTPAVTSYWVGLAQELTARSVELIFQRPDAPGTFLQDRVEGITETLKGLKQDRLIQVVHDNLTQRFVNPDAHTR